MRTSGVQPITPRQKQLLRAIYAHYLAHGSWPSFREMGEAIDAKHVNVVFGLLHALERKGYVAGTPNQVRCYRLVGVEVTVDWSPGPEGDRLREAILGAEGAEGAEVA